MWFVVGEGILRIEESPLLEVEKHGKSSIDEEGSAPQTQQLCGIGMSPGQEGIVLRVKRQTQDFWSRQKQAHRDSRAHLGSRLKHRLV